MFRDQDNFGILKAYFVSFQCLFTLFLLDLSNRIRDRNVSPVDSYLSVG